jgi:adenosylcobyric acid synthase
LHGYEIHHGRLCRSTEDDWLGVGIRNGAVYGTHWHGLLDNDDVRRQWLTAAAAAAGRDGFVVADDVDVRARRDAQLDAMADLITSHVDVAAVLALLEHGPPRLPTIAPRLTP